MQANVIGRLGTGENSWLSRFFLLVLAIVIAWLIATWPFSLAVLFVLGSILLFLALAKPRWALYTLPFAVPFGSIYEVQVGAAMVGGTEALLGCFLLGWIARRILERDLYVSRPPLWDVICLWYLVMLLSVVQSSSLAASIKELVKWGEMFALYAIAVHELEWRDIVIILAMTLLAGTLEAVEGIYQSWFLIGPEAFHYPMANRVWLRAYGRFVQPNPYAGYLGLIVPLAYGLVIVMRDKGKGHKGLTSAANRNQDEEAVVAVHAMPDRDKELYAILEEVEFSPDRLFHWAKICTGIMLIALFLTLSRGGWIGAIFAAASVSMILGDRRAPWFLLLLSGLTAMVGSMGGFQWLPTGLGNLMSDMVSYINIIYLDVSSMPLTPGNFSIIERLAHWEAALNMWAAKPWLGQGIGNYATVYPAFYTHPWQEPLGHAHNFFLNTLAETGVIGLIAYLMFSVSVLQFILEAVQRSTGLWRGIAIGIFAAMIHLHVHNVFDNLYVHGMYLHVALLMAIAAKLHQSKAVHEKVMVDW